MTAMSLFEDPSSSEGDGRRMDIREGESCRTPLEDGTQTLKLLENEPMDVFFNIYIYLQSQDILKYINGLFCLHF